MSIYVMSDLHGQYNRFLKMIKKIKLKEEDHVYILGDVIDRGKDGIDILEYIRNNTQFTLLMGNHEMMMLEYYEDQKNLYPDFYYGEIWYRNGCTPTLDKFEKLPKNTQEDIITYLKGLPIAIADLKVNDKIFYLVHAAPVKDHLSGQAYLHSAFVDKHFIHRCIWERISIDDEGIDDRCVIIGHTMTPFYQTNKPFKVYSNTKSLKKAKWIDIDCGCAANNEHSRLATIRLDDMKIFYV